MNAPEEYRFEIIAFHEFRELSDLDSLRPALVGAMDECDVLGTVIIAAEGFNGSVAGTSESVERFALNAGAILGTSIRAKSSFHASNPFRRRFVKIKPEIVTLRRSVEMALGAGTRISPSDWNDLIGRDDVLILDTRNDYEVEVGSFAGSLNPRTEKFSDLPDFVAENLDPAVHRSIATFCTGGIRCEKFVPFLRGLGFENVYQLDGGILRYLEETPPQESLWRGECFVFDERITVDERLEKGRAEDLSARIKAK